MNAELIKEVEDKLLTLEAHLDTSYVVARHAAEVVDGHDHVAQSLLHVLEDRLDCKAHHPVQQLHDAVMKLCAAAAA